MEAKKEAEWAELIDEFRALGGTAENVRLAEGNLGRGIFPQDPARPVRLHAPENLLLPFDEVEFRDGRFAVAATSSMGARERTWIEHYENALSWGDGGRRDAESFLADMYALPDSIKDKLIQFFGVRYCTEPPTAELIQKRFLSSRVIEYNTRRVVMPLIELINHGNAQPYDLDKGVGVEGTFPGEVLVQYSDGDSLLYFQNWGFAAERPTAVSLPTTVPAEFGQFRVGRDFDATDLLEIPGLPLSIRMPRLTFEEKSVTASCLLLAFRGFPRIPRSAFQRAFRQAGRTVRDDLFDQVLFANRMVFLEALSLLDEVEGQMARTLRATCRMQLTAMCHSFGIRPL